MTGNQGLVVLLVGPVLGVLIVRLLGHTTLLPILVGAVLGEWLAHLAIGMWSRRLLQSMLTHPPKDHVVGFVMVDRSLVDRLMAYGTLAVGALVIGALAFLILRAVGGLES
ncbi:MAG TPA: hypothetical protein VH559_14130 [Gemmatimonadaceae bacterium]|jgi:hypothetical protein